MTPIVLAVADTSIVIYLHRIGQLRVLCDVYSKVLLPEAVLNELGEGSPEYAAVLALSCTQRRSFLIHPNFEQPKLHAGEREVLSAALGLPGAVALLDDGRARAMAQLHELPLAGLLGILNRAKQQGLVPAVRPLVDRAVQEGYRIRESFYAAFLRRIGEA